MIWGRRPEMAARVIALLAPGPCALTVADDLERAVGQADIISCATLATEPLIRGEWLRPGQHLDLVGAYRADMSEADLDAVLRAEVYVDTYAGAMAEAGEIVQAIASGRFDRGDIAGDLSSLARGTCRGRASPESITLFKSVGTALEDLAAAELATSGAN
jgi:ornithine cyclodeaminase